MARPTKLTPRIQQAIAKALRDGNTREAAAESVGIHRSQVYRWMDRSAPFRDAVGVLTTAVEPTLLRSRAG